MDSMKMKRSQSVMGRKPVHQWAWSELGSEYAKGPFKTKQAALEDAAKNGDSRRVWIGRAVYPDPKFYMGIELDDLLQRADEHAMEDGYYSGDDALFEMIDSVGAIKEFEVFLAKWASRWVRATKFSFDALDEVDV